MAEQDSMVFFEHAESVKKIVIINDPFVSQCTVHLVDKPQDFAVNELSGSGCSYIRNSDLRNKSYAESGKRVGEPLPDGSITSKDAEKPRNEKTNEEENRRLF